MDPDKFAVRVGLASPDLGSFLCLLYFQLASAGISHDACGGLRACAGPENSRPKKARTRENIALKSIDCSEVPKQTQSYMAIKIQRFESADMFSDSKQREEEVS